MSAKSAVILILLIVLAFLLHRKFNINTLGNQITLNLLIIKADKTTDAVCFTKNAKRYCFQRMR